MSPCSRCGSYQTVRLCIDCQLPVDHRAWRCDSCLEKFERQIHDQITAAVTAERERALPLLEGIAEWLYERELAPDFIPALRGAIRRARGEECATCHRPDYTCRCEPEEQKP